MNARILCIAAGLLALTATAQASPRNHDVQATPIYRRAFYSSTTGTRTFATTNLRYNTALGCGEPDTIIVVTRPDGTEVMNDNCSSSTKASCVSASGAAGSWLVTVFAQKESAMQNAPAASAFAFTPPVPLTTHCGLTDVTVSGQLLDRDVTFGGAWIEPGLAGSFRVQTVHTPNGATDTVLLGYGSTWQELGYDNDSGVGRAAAKTWTLSAGSKLVVGSFSPAASGRAALVLNDCVSQPDGLAAIPCRDTGKDRDGDDVSNALEAELGTNADVADTDRDGLFDYYEIIGRQKGAQEQELRRFGANPRRRDLFVELDREVNADGVVANLYDEARVDVAFEDPYLDLPQLPPAPDGSRIIAVHFDTGATCPTRPTLCGDWGGAARVQSSFVDTQDAGYPAFAGVRRGLFLYGYLTTGGSGQSYGTTFYANYESAVPHEIGHNLGLSHWGALEQPSLNAKPNYPSLMNYAFQDSLPVVSPTRGRFSEGRLASMDGAIDEDSYDDGSDLRYLSAAGWELPVSTGVDFNRDGRIGGRVYADMAPLNRGTTGDDAWPHLADAMDLDATSLPTGGGALTTFELSAGQYWTVAVVPHRHPDGRVYPDVAQSVGPYGAGNWTDFEAGPGLDGAPNGEPSASMYQDAQGAVRMLLLFPHADGRLFYSVVSPGAPGTGVWRAIPGQDAGGNVRNASVARAGGDLLTMWRDHARFDVAPNLFQASFSIASQSWTTPELVIVSVLSTPGIAVTPDGVLYMAYFSDTSATGKAWIRTVRRPPGSSAWQVTGVPELDAQQDIPEDTATLPRLSLDFVPLVRGRDQAFEDASCQLHMSWSRFADPDNHDSWLWYRAQLGGYITQSTTSLTKWFVRRDKAGDRPYPGHSVATTVRGTDLVALYSAASTSALRAPRFVPFALGVRPGYVGLLDNDDAAIMNTQMCNALWQLPEGSDAAADCRCAGVACTVLPQPEVPLCEPE